MTRVGRSVIHVHVHCHAGTAVQDSTMLAADQVGLFFEQPLSGNVTLALEFSYALVLKDTGFHLDPYSAADGTQYMYGATHMEVQIHTHTIAALTVT